MVYYGRSSMFLKILQSYAANKKIKKINFDLDSWEIIKNFQSWNNDRVLKTQKVQYNICTSKKSEADHLFKIDKSIKVGLVSFMCESHIWKKIVKDWFIYLSYLHLRCGNVQVTPRRIFISIIYRIYFEVEATHNSFIQLCHHISLNPEETASCCLTNNKALYLLLLGHSILNFLLLCE